MSIMVVLGVLRLAASVLKDSETVKAIFKSDMISDEEKDAIRAMRQSLEDKWDSLAPPRE